MMALQSTIPWKKRGIFLQVSRGRDLFQVALQVGLGGHGGKYIDGRGLAPGLAGGMSEMTAEQRTDR